MTQSPIHPRADSDRVVPQHFEARLQDSWDVIPYGKSCGVHKSISTRLSLDRTKEISKVGATIIYQDTRRSEESRVVYSNCV